MNAAAVILVIGTILFFQSDTLQAHTVPACCIAPHPPSLNDPDFPNYPYNYCEARRIEKGKEKWQAPESNGGDAVRSNNKHCQPDHVSPEGPNG
jgi:hypothetical protein